MVRVAIYRSPPHLEEVSERFEAPDGFLKGLGTPHAVFTFRFVFDKPRERNESESESESDASADSGFRFPSSPDSGTPVASSTSSTPHLKSPDTCLSCLVVQDCATVNTSSPLQGV